MLEREKGILEKTADGIWRLFASVKLAVVLLIVLALVSIIGTIIQQDAHPEHYLREYGPSTVRLFELLGFFDMYHAWWFVLLLFLLTANLIVCSLERFPHAWKSMRAPLSLPDDDCLKTLPFKKEIHCESIALAEARVKDVLKKRRFEIAEFREAGTLRLAAQKGKYSRLGVYITHLSIILIITGALLGTFFGFKAFLSLPEGSDSNIVYLRSAPLWEKIKVSLGAATRVQWSEEADMPVWPLDFTVRCDDFDVDYYVNPTGMPTGMPSEYRSTLSIFDSRGAKLLGKRITVNDPLKFRGLTFYQSSYGTVPGAQGSAVLRVRKKGGTEETVTIGLEKTQYVASIDRTIKVTAFAPFASRDPHTRKVLLHGTANHDYINPAVQLQIYKGKSLLYTTEILKTDPAAPGFPENYTIDLLRFSGARYTGLQVAKDPGVWVIYAGFTLLCLGPLLAFFGSHKKLWVSIENRNGRAGVVVSGSVSKNRPGFEREFSSIVEQIGT